MAIHNLNVPLTNVVKDPGSVCSNPDVSYTLPQNITLVCDNGDSLDIQINDNIPGPYCITFLVDCSASCKSCGTIVITKCFCINGDDCENCSNCDENVCVSRCDPGQVCNGDTCGECSAEHPCQCNQECSQGVCRCPAGKKKRADGCCVECFDDDELGNCLICEDGEIKAVNCPDGHCNQNTGDCQECLNNSHCSGEPNQCCGPTGQCECCPGFILDPLTGDCVKKDPCNNAQDCVDLFGPCFYCTETGCAPKPCPTGFVCDPTSGECVPGCINGVCPEGQGCLNGRCVNCSELSCTGNGELCQFAEGCQCNSSNVCEYINCNPQTVDLQWVVTPGTPGNPVPGTGSPALQGSTLITPTGLIAIQPPTGATYQNHEFNLSVPNGTTGTWTLYHTPSTSVVLGTGTSILFDLAGTAPSNGPNLVGFLVKFVEAGTGRVANWGFYRTPTAPLTAENVWNSEFNSTGTAPSFTGSMPGSVKLCSTNGNFRPTGVTNVQTTGDISITFYPDNNGCLIAVIVGCGTWNGDVILSCGGTTTTVAAPSFTKDPANCCDPTDVNCGGWSTGEPCVGLDVQNIALVALPTFGLNVGGDGEFLIVADWTSAGLSFFDMFYLDPADSCWSATGDFFIVTNNSQSPFGPSVSNLSVVATLGDAGCIRLGHTCELAIGECKKLQGEICLTECSGFTVDIVQTGTYTFMAAPSKQDEVVTYVWTYPGLVNNTGQTITIVPQGGVTTLTVTASYGSPVKCTAVDQISFNTVFPGCTNRAACNYDATATTDDGTCVILGNPGYDCALGGFQPGFIDATSINTPTVQWKIAGVVVPTNSQLSPGTYTVDVFVNGIQKCSKSLVVPQCYRCSSGTCIPAPVGENTGPYSVSNCNDACSCDIEINVTQNCASNRSALVITATGDTGTYTVTVNKVGGAQVLAPTAFNTAGSVTTPLLCNGVYRIIVQGANCNKSVDYTATCGTCAGATTDLTDVSYDCDTNQLFATIVADACATGYTIRLINIVSSVIVTQAYISAGAKTIPLGVYPGDGAYTVQLVDSNGCIRTEPLVLNCNGTLADCSIESAGLTYSISGAFVSFTSTFNLDTAGESFNVALYTTTGGGPSNCTTALRDAIITQQNVTGVEGLNTVNFPNAVAIPGINTCYIVLVRKAGLPGATCYNETAVLVQPSAPPPTGCSLIITNVSYNTNTGETLISWQGSGTSNDITVNVRTDGDNVCSGADPLVIDSSGNGEDGLNIPFAGVSQIQGTTQCLTIEIFDTNDPTCGDSTTYSLAGCTCEVVIDEDSLVIDPDAELVEITVTTRCTSGDVTIDISGDAIGSETINDASTDGTTDTHTIVVALTGYPSTGGSVTLEAVDDVDVGCIDTYGFALPANCTSCAQVVNFGAGDITVESVVDVNANVIAGGTYDMTIPADLATLEADIEAGTIAEGGNYCATGTKVDVARNPAYAGATVNQDSDDFVVLDYAVVSSADFVGTRDVFFGDCGCEVGTLCDYEAIMDLNPLLGATGDIDCSLYYGDLGGAQYSKNVAFNLGPIGSIDASDTAGLEAAILNALETASCGYTVGDVTVAWDNGTSVLTITITGTNAALGLIYASEEDGLILAEVFDFTQSNCV